MKKFLKKTLIYMIMTMLVFPASLLTMAMGAQKAKAAVDIVGNPTVQSFSLNDEVADAHINPNYGDTVRISVTADRAVKFNAIDIYNSSDVSVKHFYQTSDFNTDVTKTWDGKNSSDVTLPDGIYSVKVRMTDEAGLVSVPDEFLANAIIIDTVAPALTLNGPDFLTIGDNSEYIEQGVTAIDDSDGDITASINTEIGKYQPETGTTLPAESVDSTQTGIYFIVYSATDSAGNIGGQLRMIFVQPEGGAKINLPVFMNPDGTLAENLRADFQQNKQAIISLFLQNGSIISGIDWNGVFNLPETTDLGSIILPVDKGYLATDVVGYEIGAGATGLSLDQPAKIVFYGKAGYRVGSIDQTGVFTEVSDQCVISEEGTVPELAEGGACKIDSGADLVIWTKHFTTFIAYTQTVIAPVISEVKPSTENGQYFLKVTWGNADASNFKFYVNDLETTPVSIIGNTAVLKVSATGDYKVKMKAIVGDTESAFSNEVTATVQAAAVVETVPAPVAVETAPLAPTVTKAKAATNPEPAVENSTQTTTDNEGIIKGDEKKDESADTTNWTPWIILFILIVFAGAATGGYFYWFAGKEDEEKSTAPKKAKVEKKEKVSVTVRSKQSKPNKKSKRW